MGRIIYVKDLSGLKPVKNHIIEIANKAKEGDAAYIGLVQYIAQALDYLKDIEVPLGKKDYLLGWNTTDVWDQNRPLTFHIVKKAVTQPSVFEFRINWAKLYFRALFFVDNHPVDKQFKFFARSLLKEEPNPPELQLKINETELVAMMYSSNPVKYLKEWSQ